MTPSTQAGIDYENINVNITFEDSSTINIIVPFIREYNKPINKYNAIAEIRDKDFPLPVVNKRNDIKTIQSEELGKTWEVCSTREVKIDGFYKGVWEKGLPPLTAYDLKEI
jgi:hypothetical protein